VNRDITSREQRLAPTAGPSENAFTIEIRLVCPVDNRHHVGTLYTGSGSSWSLQDLRPTVITRYAEPGPEPRSTQTDRAETIFDFLDDEDHVSGSSRDPDGLEEQPVATSVLRWEQTPTGEPRLRWECCHCSIDRRRLARPDNVLRGIRLAQLVCLMREHGPSRLRVELSASSLESAAVEVLRHAEHSAPDSR
jgi:hypothetical protein